MKEESEMTTKIILVVVAITTAMMLSMMAGQVSTQVVYGAKEKCISTEYEDGHTTSVCVEQGRDPTVSSNFCDPEFGCFPSEFEVTHRQGAEIKTDELQICKQLVNDNDDDGATCSTK